MFAGLRDGLPEEGQMLRPLLALVFVALYFTGTVSGTVGIVLLVLAGVFLLTSIFGVCPLYSLFGVNTCTVRH